ncbi:MAG: hypothetical protein Q7W54_05885, partial [Bacteroidota bacterium]|nr:hypothetical protein [Bacteroidota bacterium]
MKLNSGRRMKLIGSMLLMLVLSWQNYASATEPDKFYVFDESKIRIDGKLTLFVATFDIKEYGLKRFILNIYLHWTNAAEAATFNVSVNFPK